MSRLLAHVVMAVMIMSSMMLASSLVLYWVGEVGLWPPILAGASLIASFGILIHDTFRGGDYNE